MAELSQSLVGEKVKYSPEKGKEAEGFVYDKIDMFNKLGDNFTVTGYLIQTTDGKLLPIAYWRILSVLS